jgi:hypothetical protein
MKTPGMKAAIIAALVVSGVSLTGCMDDRPGYNSDRHRGRDHDRDRDRRHERRDRNDEYRRQ